VDVPVVLCTWKRPERLRLTLEMLAGQERHRPRLHIWNNNAELEPELRECTRGSWPFEIAMFTSAVNVGGFGRFLWARALARDESAVVFIDDDLNFRCDALATLMAEHRPRTLTAWWAFRLLDPADYWNRSVLEPGDEADYCGTGGMVCDTAVFREAAFFACPERHSFLEDIWLSYYVSHRLGWRKYRSAARIAEVIDGKNQMDRDGVIDQKAEFLRLLTGDGGWRLPREAGVS
jgi:hypothetical protein